MMLTLVFGFQVYEVTLLAVRVMSAVSPTQTSMTVAFNDTLGNGNTLTATVSCDEQPCPAVPMTVYVVLTVGEAETEAPVVVVKPVEGDHEKFAAPTAESVAEAPL